MNRYPVWKYAIMVIVLLLGVLYTLPNFFGEAPAVQVSSIKATVKVDNAVRQRVEEALKAGSLTPDSVVLEGNSIFARFDSVDNQAKAKSVIEKALIPDSSDPTFIVAQNMLTRSPAWLTALHARPMYLGLDLRGGVHFMLQVDMAAAITKKVESYAGDLRSSLRDKNIRHGGVSRDGDAVEVKVRDDATLTAARNLVSDNFPDLVTTSSPQGDGFVLRATIKPDAMRKVQEQALKQNITTLHNRINELGVAEPVIQQQGLDRIIVQLPGVQDTAKAKDILGRTATLEVRLVDESSEARSAELGQGPVPFGSEKYLDRNQMPVIVKKQVILTGENLNDAQPGFDGQTQEPTVNLTLDAKGARIFKDVTRDNVGKRMAIILFEKGKGEVVTAPVIRTEIGGGRVQISGRMTTVEANDTSLLLRAGSLAAPMEIIEEYTIGPSLGEDNIQRGIHSVVWGMAAIAVFMCFYYMIFGVISTISLGVNVLLLLAILSMLQATLTLPGIAAMALALGVAIDSNVLINERIREELRAGVAPQQAISAGYQHAWATILDSNVTTLIAGLALLAFGSGPVRGFAVVHCIGILTSMFSAVFFSRGLVNLWYGRQKKLKSVSIGQVWKPEGDSGHRSVASGRAVSDSDGDQ
ncbi:protein translocase subunit SecD [Diaphorobacter ruginosibacter]|uniref:Protein translocase subunit SecD n=1 Tax=Diaphorobacter ruginosibacter TaxID=1715720 RepID=A0A7G9RN80_9BURK|nr:protein translocase subunit SecD [Diaphorobacter ruginosibacter]QNN57055.1 protein translocase subunit SecD [Diaphorobacter ruginosibacter]